jgi:alkylation response protein AidB-like acyl-CoA dehydrogenase
VLAMRTQTRLEWDAYRLSGVKTFITNGGIEEETLGDAFTEISQVTQAWMLGRRLSGL